MRKQEERSKAGECNDMGLLFYVQAWGSAFQQRLGAATKQLRLWSAAEKSGAGRGKF